MKQYIADTFIYKVFSGILRHCILNFNDKIMMSIAAENNLSEQAFAGKEDKNFGLYEKNNNLLRFKMANSSVLFHNKKRQALNACRFLERVKGIEPSYPAWEAGVLPLNYTRTLNKMLF